MHCGCINARTCASQTGVPCLVPKCDKWVNDGWMSKKIRGEKSTTWQDCPMKERTWITALTGTGTVKTAWPHFVQHKVRVLSDSATKENQCSPNGTTLILATSGGGAGLSSLGLAQAARNRVRTYLPCPTCLPWLAPIFALPEMPPSCLFLTLPISPTQGLWAGQTWPTQTDLSPGPWRCGRLVQPLALPNFLVDQVLYSTFVIHFDHRVLYHPNRSSRLHPQLAPKADLVMGRSDGMGCLPLQLLLFLCLL